MDRRSQTYQDVILSIPMMRKDGTQASGMLSSQLYTKITKPDGTVLTGYDEATITEPNSNGIYVVKFPTSATNKAFTVESSANPYSVTLHSILGTVAPMTVNVWIVSGASPTVADYAGTIDAIWQDVPVIGGGLTKKVAIAFSVFDGSGDPVLTKEDPSEFEVWMRTVDTEGNTRWYNSDSGNFDIEPYDVWNGTFSSHVEAGSDSAKLFRIQTKVADDRVYEVHLVKVHWEDTTRVVDYTLATTVIGDVNPYVAPSYNGNLAFAGIVDDPTGRWLHIGFNVFTPSGEELGSVQQLTDHQVFLYLKNVWFDEYFRIDSESVKSWGAFDVTQYANLVRSFPVPTRSPSGIFEVWIQLVPEADESQLLFQVAFGRGEWVGDEPPLQWSVYQFFNTIMLGGFGYASMPPKPDPAGAIL